MNEGEVFIEALQQQDPAARIAYLDEVGRHDPAFRRRIEALLKTAEQVGICLESPAPGVASHFLRRGQNVEATASADKSERPGAAIGPYKLLEQIGEGGFGVVYRADQTDPVRRTVALKVL